MPSLNYKQHLWGLLYISDGCAKNLGCIVVVFSHKFHLYSLFLVVVKFPSVSLVTHWIWSEIGKEYILVLLFTLVIAMRGNYLSVAHHCAEARVWVQRCWCCCLVFWVDLHCCYSSSTNNHGRACFFLGGGIADPIQLGQGCDNDDDDEVDLLMHIVVLSFLE